MRMTITRSVIICLLILLTAAVCHAVPNRIGFQGQLMEDGANLTGFRTVTFSIWSSDAGGDPADALWYESRTVEIVDGVYQVHLGDDTPLPAGLYLNAELFMQVDVVHPSLGSQRLAPLTPITSAVFAFQAAHADDTDTLQGQSLADLDATYVMRGETGAVTSAMIVDNSIDGTDLADNSLTASDLADNSVRASEIDAGAVGTSEIADGSVSWEDLEKGAVLQEILDDDGAGSGLDADLLDGQHRSYFATSTHNHDSRYVNSSGGTITGNLGVEGDLSVGTDSGTDDDYLFMHSGTTEWLGWENSQTRFKLTDALNLLGSLAVGGHISQPAFNSIGTGTPSSASISNSNDLFIRESLEVGINAYVDGSLFIGTDNPDDDDAIYMDSSNEYLRWDESETEFLLSNDIRVNGEYHYSSPQTYYLNIPTPAFVTQGLDDETWVTYAYYAYIADGSAVAPYSVKVLAPVNLPQGATVTGFRLYYMDDLWGAGLTISGSLIRSRVTHDTMSTVNLAYIASTDSSGDDDDIDFVEDTSIVYDTIENRDYQYAISVQFTVPSPTIGSALRFYGARVAYTVDRVGN